MNDYALKLENLFGQSIENNVDLSRYTKIGIGGQAKFFLPCKNIESFNNFISIVEKNNIFYWAIKYNEDVLVQPGVLEKLVIFLITPENKQPKTITLFQPILITDDIKKILIKNRFSEFLKNKKSVFPDDIFFKMGLVDKVFGGLKQIPESPNIAVNFQQATIDDVVIMSSYLKQQVRDNLGIQLRDNYKFINNN